jgi:hypothetical protein
MLARFQAEAGRRLAGSLPAQFVRFPFASRYTEALDLRPSSRLLQVGGSPELGRWLAGVADTRLAVTAHPGAAARPEAVAWPGSLPFSDASFDALFAPDLLRKLNNDELWPFLVEAARVTAPGGVILLIDVPPVRSRVIEAWHGLVVGGQRRGWASLLHLISETGAFSTAQLVDPGPCLWPPVPRIGIRLVRR